MKHDHGDVLLVQLEHPGAQVNAVVCVRVVVYVCPCVRTARVTRSEFWDEGSRCEVEGRVGFERGANATRQHERQEVLAVSVCAASEDDEVEERQQV